ncbi:MAG: SpoIIE family protein phosphatase [Desulfomonile tiedjei]|nr:SpoIIE family protein phosphatase [Desulfomonile tiedjei]
MSFKLRLGITIKMTLLVLCGTAAVFAFVLYRSGLSSEELIVTDAKRSAEDRARSVARQLDSRLQTVAKITEIMVLALESGNWDERTLFELIRRVVKDNKDVYGTAVAFEPHAFNPDVKAYAPYYYKAPGGPRFVQLGTETYDYFMQDWYHIPKEMSRPMWSAPYFDEGGGNRIMTTYSSPFFSRSGKDAVPKLRGIVTADLTLERLTAMVSEVRMAETGFAFLISEQGTFLSHPDKSLEMRESMFSLAEERHKPELGRIGRDMIRNQSGILDVGDALRPEDCFLAYQRLDSTGWSVGVIFPKSELFASTEELKWSIIKWAAVGAILLLAVSFLMARSVTSPLHRMAQATRRVAEGDLDIDLSDIRQQDEVGELAQSLTTMARDLKTYIRNLTETTAAKQRIESELSIAADIQRSMLPSRFPAFPGRDEFDIYAMMRPAKEVGGDFYDFFLLDEDHLCVAIGDVSGKGVPAALFMSVTKYLLEAGVGLGGTADQVMSRVNALLARNNDSCMFVTLFLGILDLRTGEFFYANGGHNSPVLLVPDQEPAFLGKPGGPVVGIMDTAEFRMDTLVLSPGSVLLTYTDGVTEAFNTADEAFAEDRLLETARSLRDKSVKDMTTGLVDAIDAFCSGAPQADDITVLTLVFGKALCSKV